MKDSDIIRYKINFIHYSAFNDLKANHLSVNADFKPVNDIKRKEFFCIKKGWN